MAIFKTEYMKGILTFKRNFSDLVANKVVVYNGDDMGHINNIAILNYKSFLKIPL